MTIIKMTDLDLNNKRVLIREDFNVPVKNGVVTSDARIHAALFTIETLIKANAKVMIMSHLGRPKEGQFNPDFSLEPVAKVLSKLLDHPVRFEQDWIDGVDIKPGEVVLCENVRFLEGEKANGETLSKKMADCCDVFVMDAFGTAHRKQASTYGVAQFAPMAVAGPLLTTELEALTHALNDPSRPLTSIVGGSKVSTKIGVLKSIINLSDVLVLGGGILNTILAANKINVGKSLYEPDLVAEATTLLKLAQAENTKIPLPQDVIVAKEFSESAKACVKNVEELDDDDMILDIGPKSQQNIAKIMENSKTIIWNGPIGVFEFEQFSSGTKALAKAIAHSESFSIAGGGDTLAAIEKFNISEKISYISTGGGAFLEFLERHKLPAISILEQRALLFGQKK